MLDVMPLLARLGSTASASTPSPTCSSAKAPTARTCPRPTPSCASCGRHVDARIPRRPHAAGRGQPVARGRGRLLRDEATSATWASISRSCPGSSWRCAGSSATRSPRSWTRPRRSPASCQWGIFLRNHDELTLEMVTDEERDYMYAEYARDPRMKLNLGHPAAAGPAGRQRPARDRAAERAAALPAGHARPLLRRRDRHGRQHLSRRPQRRAHPDAVERRPQRRLLSRADSPSSTPPLMTRSTATRR